MTSASNATMSRTAKPASSRIPLLNTSLSPRVCSWRGMNRSCARTEPSSGKPLNAVFAARISTSAVAAWMKKKPIEPSPPNVAAAICAMTVRCGSVSQFGEALEVAGVLDVLDVGRAAPARSRRRTSSAAMPPISASVVAAFRLFGGLNAGTPLAIASTPVSAVQPEANARSAKNSSARPASCS